MPKTEGYI